MRGAKALAAFMASLSGLTLDGKIEAFEAEIASMEGEPWEQG